MRRKLVLPAAALIALCAVAVPAIAEHHEKPAPAIPGAMDASRITGGTYQADSAHTLVGWRVNHLGFNDYFGIFGDVQGTLTLDPAKPAEASVAMTIPIAAVTVASAGLKDHLLKPGADGGAPDFFGAEPAAATFVSTSVAPTSATEAKITGDLTLNGVTRPVTIDARFTGAGNGPMNKAETVGFEGTATIMRSDFGIGYGVPMVSDAVELEITAAFEKPPAG